MIFKRDSFKLTNWFQPAALALAGLLIAATATRAATNQQDRIWTLESAVRYAIANSPNTRAAQYRIAAAEAGIQQANAAFMPQLSIGSSYLVTDNPMLVFGSALNQNAFDFSLIDNAPDTDNFNVHGMLSVPLYNGGRNAAGRRAAKSQAAAAEQLSRGVRNNLSFEVARAFYTIQKTHEFVRATDAAVASFESNLTVAKQRYEGGTALKNEALDVEVHLAQAKEERIRARNAYQLSHRVLGNLLGLTNQLIQISEEVTTVAVPESDDYSSRPELQAVMRQSQAAEAAVRREQGGFLPRIDAFGRYDYDRGWKFDGWGDSYAAGVNLNWKLWDGDLTRAKVRQAQAEFEASRENIRRVQLAVDLEVEQARIQMAESAERLAVTEKAVTQAEESARLTRVRFDQGLALATQLIDSETALTAARVRRAEAEANQQIATAALRKALGLPLLPPDQTR